MQVPTASPDKDPVLASFRQYFDFLWWEEERDWMAQCMHGSDIAYMMVTYHCS